MTEAISAALIVLAFIYIIGTLATLVIGFADYSFAAESLKRADEYLAIADKVRREARAEIAVARERIRYPFLWPLFLAGYALAVKEVVNRDEEANR